MKILLTCGLGDFIAIESYLTPKEIRSIDTIYWATRARESLLPLIPFAFPNVKNHVIVRDEWTGPWTDGFCIKSIEELSLPDDVIDFSIKDIINSTIQGHRRYQGSFLVKQNLESIDHLNLPEKFFVVHPYSENARTEARDITSAEWTLIWRNLRSSNIPIVIINKGEEKLKQYPNVIDLTDKLTLIQAIEVVKQSSGFIGASSIFSVVASKVLAPGQLFIKGHKLLKDEYAWFYYAPHDDAYQLVVQDLTKIVHDLKRFGGSREITVNTVQGIGDIFWVYQKLAPYFDKINLNILCTEFSIIQQRSKDLAKMLPKVGTVTFTRVLGPTYEELCKSDYKLSDVLKAYESFINGEIPNSRQRELGSLLVGTDIPTVNYSVNSPLERGVRLDKLDPSSMIEEFVDLGLEVSAPTEDYLCVFVAGAKNDSLWKPNVWVKLIDGLMARIKLKKVVLVGAEWDLPVQTEIHRLLKDRYEVLDYVNEFDIIDTIDVIRRSRFFLAYQSGLSILADNYDVPQLMIYFEQLKPMMYSWCKQKNIGTVFQAATFDESIDSILDKIKL